VIGLPFPAVPDRSKDQFAEQQLATIGELNAAGPDNPVMVTHGASRSCWTAPRGPGGIQPAVETVDVARRREHNRRG